MSLPLLGIPLQGRTALVTGGATGIGTEIGRALAAAGATVAVNHLGQDPYTHVLRAAFERDGSPGIAVNSDLTDPTAVQTMADLVRAVIAPSASSSTTPAFTPASPGRTPTKPPGTTPST
ncbi:SDR family NAD(P)-dependent oxidoreductase [Streptomyces goshikiensis]|uniref:SDR family NAD(P)-dependent oxidoreductase n=1 Tax=Streptomyces goshikiensis TaxID=1942 RepID=UPI003677ED5D